MLHLSRTLADAIREEARAAAPRECCGLLLGNRKEMRIDAILPAANVAADPQRRFEIDPALLLGAHRSARAGGPEIVGHYHSHPLGDPTPSPHDAAMAQEDGAIWLLIGAGDRLAAWRAVAGGQLEGRFSSIVMKIGDESGLAPSTPDRH